MQYAAGWIQSGPPYFGKSSFEDKGTMFRLGAQFDKGKKMWMAKTEAVLLQLAESGKWTPDGPLADSVAWVLREKEQRLRDAKNAQEQKRLDENRSRVLTKEEQILKLKKELGVPPDEPEKLQELWEKYQVESCMVEQTLVWDPLGPKSGISAAQRLLRGFRWDLVTLEELREGQLKKFANKQSKYAENGKPSLAGNKRARKAPEGNTAPAPAPVDPYSREAVQAYQNYQNYQANQFPDAEGEAHVEHSIRDPGRMKWVADTRCTVCDSTVCDQFLCCNCFDAEWKQCKSCKEKFRVDANVSMWNANRMCQCPSEVR